MRARTTYVERYRRDLIAAFGALADTGNVRLMTSAATHGCLPLLAVNEQAVRMQVALGMSEFRRLFGRPTSGFWLPECAYYAGLDRVLADAGVRYFCVDTHAIELASSPPIHGVYAPLFCPAGVAAFGRDAECARQVWSSIEGLSRRFRLPRVLSRHRLRPARGDRAAVPAPERRARVHRHQVLPRDRHERSQGALQSRLGARQSRAARGPLRREPGTPDGPPARRGPASRRSSRCRSTPSSSVTGGTRDRSGSTTSAATSPRRTPSA